MSCLAGRFIKEEQSLIHGEDIFWLDVVFLNDLFKEWELMVYYTLIHSTTTNHSKWSGPIVMELV
jgi:hypothetical protein